MARRQRQRYGRRKRPGKGLGLRDGARLLASVFYLLGSLVRFL